MWIDGNYRRNLLDMHIDDWNPEFLSKIDVDEYVNALKDAGVQTAMIKSRTHTGLAYYPTKIGRMHRGLKGFDYFGTMIKKCHDNGIAAVAYFSQIFDNWAYDNYPEWRLVTAEGKKFREYRGGDNYKSGRYGIVCPNNEGYRSYVRACLTEINENYDFEGMFLDMTFFPEVCYCESCQNKYKKETGKEIPRVIDWNDPEWLTYIEKRNHWISEFASFSTSCVKAVKPNVLVEHQFSRITGSWVDGSTEDIMKSSDYASGDYYGGFLQQTFINKYYRNVSKNLPFVYHTSRCDPELNHHTTTKTKDELLQHVVTALVHNGAFLLVDAINPDGSIDPNIYHKLMKEVYSVSKQFERYVGGNLEHDVSIFFASHAKFNPYETNIGIMEKSFNPSYYMESPLGATSILRESHILFDVIGAGNIANEGARLLLLPHVARLQDEEMDDIEEYLQKGGNLLISGPIGHPRLQEIMGVRVIGRTEHDFTYMSPTSDGKEFFAGFSQSSPLTIDDHQVEINVVNKEGIKILATLTLPYTMTGTEKFAAIHSNPPGIYTKNPCAILKDTGRGKILWTAAPIEMSKPYMSRNVYSRMVKYLCGTRRIQSNAPKCVEILWWNKEEVDYFAVINEQEENPVYPFDHITVDVQGKAGYGAYLLPGEEELFTFDLPNGDLRIELPELDIFLIFELRKNM